MNNKSSRDYRMEAMDLLRGRYETPIVVLIVFVVIGALISYLLRQTGPEIHIINGIEYTGELRSPVLYVVIQVLSIFVSAAIEFAQNRMFIQVSKNQEVDANDIITFGFKKDFVNNALTYFVRSIFIFLWFLLFIIPGIVKAYAYSMTFYLKNRMPNADGLSLITRSKELTMGHKGKIFMLDLSYIGWYILSLFTFGILLLWVYPRHMTARTIIFNEIYEPFESKEEVKIEKDEDDIFDNL